MTINQLKAYKTRMIRKIKRNGRSSKVDKYEIYKTVKAFEQLMNKMIYDAYARAYAEAVNQLPKWATTKLNDEDLATK